jgi:hypothetical protein
VRSPQRPIVTAAVVLMLAGASRGQVTQRVSVNPRRIRSGKQRVYQMIYRDPIVLGGCPASSTFNATQAGVVTWMP